jgi:hypothetical protein
MKTGSVHDPDIIILGTPKSSARLKNDDGVGYI